MSQAQPLLTYLLRQADRLLVLSQRLGEWTAHAHELEEEMALTNIALDLLGQARLLYQYASEIENSESPGSNRDEDFYAYQRGAQEFMNPLLVEQPNGDFAHTMVRQLLHDAFALPYWQAMTSSRDQALAAIAGKAVKESSYHLRHARGWILRLGDGTEESHRRCQEAFDWLWRYHTELFETDSVEVQLIAAGVAADPAEIRQAWRRTLADTMREATLRIPETAATATGGRRGLHSEHLSYLLGELQVVARAHPGASW